MKSQDVERQERTGGGVSKTCTNGLCDSLSCIVCVFCQ